MTRRKRPDDPSDPLAIPAFLRRKAGRPARVQHAVVDQGRKLVDRKDRDPLSAYAPSAREEAAKMAALPKVQEDKKVRLSNKFGRWKAYEATKNFNPRTMRWDPRLGRAVDARPFEVLAPEYLKRLRFTNLSGPELVRAYNELCYTAAARGIVGCQTVRRFKSDDEGRQVCKRFRDDLVGGRRAAPASGRVGAPEPRGVSQTMAKKSKKKVKSERKPREIGRAAGKVEDFRPVRAGTDRAAVLKLATEHDRTVDKIAELSKLDRKTVLTHLYFISKECGIGYAVKDGVVKVSFPGSKGIDDAIKQTEEKKAA